MVRKTLARVRGDRLPGWEGRGTGCRAGERASASFPREELCHDLGNETGTWEEKV